LRPLGRFTLDSSGQVLFNHPVGSLQRSIPFQRSFDYVQLAVERRVTNPLWKVCRVWMHICVY
jgi:hypothetical protein